MFIRWAFCCIFYWRDIRLTAGILPMRFFFTLCLFLAGVSSRNEEPDFSAEEWRECSEGGKRLVTAMLQKNPENRTRGRFIRRSVAWAFRWGLEVVGSRGESAAIADESSIDASGK